MPSKDNFTFYLYEMRSKKDRINICVKFYIGNFYSNLPKKIEIWLKLDKNLRHLT